MIVEVHVRPPEDWRPIDRAKLYFPPHALVYALRIEDHGDLVKLFFDVTHDRIIHIENGRFEVLIAKSEKMDGYILRKWRYVEPVKVSILSQIGEKEPSP